MTNRTLRSRRARSLAVVAALVTGGLLAVPGPAGAIPADAPKTGMVCTAGTVTGNTHTFNLVAKTGYIETPDGNSVFMWSYANADAPDLGHFQFPGPVLCVTQGQTVVVNLQNGLPEPSSIVFPGQDAQVNSSGGTAGLFTTEAAPSASISYSFAADDAGTYLYESGSDSSKQIEMGLYGALIVRPAGAPNQAYGAASTQFNPDREYLILLNEVDPALHHAVETSGVFDITTLHNRYFQVNGRSFPDTIQDNGSGLLPNQPYGALVRIQPTAAGDPPALIRMINAGLDNHPYHPHGNHLTQIAQDGRLVAPTEHFGETIGSGVTEDYLLRWDNHGTDTSGAPFNDDWDPLSNQLPVAQPNYRDLTFKDGNTWYSGTPYLGYKGTLPTGTVSQNICGEWYFPWHSHALNEFSNFDEGFGGMATLLRVDPLGGCIAAPSSTTLIGGVLKSGDVTNLATSDNSYYQINPRTTSLTAAVSATTTATPTTLNGAVSATATTISVASNNTWPAAPYYIQVNNEIMQVTAKGPTGGPPPLRNLNWTVSRHQLGTTATTHASGVAVSYVNGLAVASAAGFPTSGSFYIRTLDAIPTNQEVMQVTAGQGTTGWLVNRAQLGTTAHAHSSGTTVSALATDWYATTLNVPAGSQNLRVTYEGKNCGSTTSSLCTALTANLPQQTVSICDWTVSGGAGCASATSNGWVTLPAPPAQPQVVGSTDLSSTWQASPVLSSNYIGTGAYSGQVRVLVHTQRWTSPNPTTFSTWGDFMRLAYNAP